MDKLIKETHKNHKALWNWLAENPGTEDCLNEKCDWPGWKMNGGKNGGRMCWAVTGTLCGGKAQGSFAQKRLSCTSCLFFAKVKEEEGDRFVLLRPGQTYKSHG